MQKLYPHQKNPNEISEGYYQKLKDNIASTGKYPALIVRPWKDGFQIIDGHKRAIVLRDLGYEKIKCEVWNVNDKQTLILLATLNRLRGSDDTYKRACLINAILEEYEDESFFDLIPESNRAIDSLLKLYKDEFDIDAERGLIEEQLLTSGVDPEKAEQIANLYQPPGGKPIIKFVFDGEEDYNRAVKFFGMKADTKKLMKLIDTDANDSNEQKKATL